MSLESLFDNERNIRYYLDSILELEAILNEEQQDLTLLLDRFLQQLMGTLLVPRGCILSFDCNSNHLRLESSYGVERKTFSAPLALTMQEGLLYPGNEVFFWEDPPAEIEEFLEENAGLLGEIDAYLGGVLRLKGQFLGMVILSAKFMEECYSERDLKILKILFPLLSHVLYREASEKDFRKMSFPIKRLPAPPPKKYTFLERMQRMLISLDSVPDSRSLIQELLKGGVKLLSAESGAVFLTQPHNPLLKLAEQVGLEEETSRAAYLSRNNKLLGKCFEEKKGVILDKSSDRRLASIFNSRHLMVMPLQVHHELFALMVVAKHESDCSDSHFNEMDLKLMGVWTRYAELTLESFEAYRESKEVGKLHHHIFEGMTTAVFMANLLGEIESANAAAVKMLDKSQNAILGSHYQILFQKDPHIIELIQQTQANGIAYHEQSATCCTIAKDALVNVAAAPLKSEQDKPGGVVIALEEMIPENKIKKLFKRKVSNQIVNELMSREVPLDLSGESREAVICIYRISNLPELLKKTPPAELFEMLNEYFRQIRKIIFKYHGTLNKFEPTELLAVFGAPLSQKNDLKNALKTTLELIALFQSLNKKRRQMGYPAIKMTIAVCRGNVMVGSSGILEKSSYLVFGEAVQAAQHISLMAKPQEIWVCESCHEKGKDDFEFRELKKTRVKGWSKVIWIYQLLNLKEQQLQNEAAPQK